MSRNYYGWVVWCWISWPFLCVIEVVGNLIVEIYQALIAAGKRVCEVMRMPGYKRADFEKLHRKYHHRESYYKEEHKKVRDRRFRPNNRAT
jgi:hypothetical protein